MTACDRRALRLSLALAAVFLLMTIASAQSVPVPSVAFDVAIFAASATRLQTQIPEPRNGPRGAPASGVLVGFSTELVSGATYSNANARTGLQVTPYDGPAVRWTRSSAGCTPTTTTSTYQYHTCNPTFIRFAEESVTSWYQDVEYWDNFGSATYRITLMMLLAPSMCMTPQLGPLLPFNATSTRRASIALPAKLLNQSIYGLHLTWRGGGVSQDVGRYPLGSQPFTDGSGGVATFRNCSTCGPVIGIGGDDAAWTTATPGYNVGSPSVVIVLPRALRVEDLADLTVTTRFATDAGTTTSGVVWYAARALVEPVAGCYGTATASASIPRTGSRTLSVTHLTSGASASPTTRRTNSMSAAPTDTGTANASSSRKVW